jgi:hypothetical protein
MLVREQGNDLHLLSVVSPAWLKPGDVIAVKQAPTEFGEVNYELRTNPGGALLTLSNRLTTQPQRVVVHLPVGKNVTRVSAGGKGLKVQDSAVVIPAETREVTIRWTPKPGAHVFSYEKAVADYKAEYRRRHEAFVRTGVRP